MEASLSQKIPTPGYPKELAILSIGDLTIQIFDERKLITFIGCTNPDDKSEYCMRHMRGRYSLLEFVSFQSTTKLSPFSLRLWCNHTCRTDVVNMKSGKRKIAIDLLDLP